MFASGKHPSNGIGMASVWNDINTSQERYGMYAPLRGHTNTDDRMLSFGHKGKVPVHELR